MDRKKIILTCGWSWPLDRSHCRTAAGTCQNWRGEADDGLILETWRRDREPPGLCLVVKTPQWCPLASSSPGCFSREIEDLEHFLLHEASLPASLQINFNLPCLGELLHHPDGQRAGEDHLLLRKAKDRC